MTQHFLHAILLCTVFLAGCASKSGVSGLPGVPGLPDNPVLATPTTTRASEIPGGPLQSITPGQVGGFKIAHAEPPKELWDRIRRGFAMPDLQDTLVADREQWYSSRPDYIQRMTERSSKYLFHIVEELERRQMPTELALLPFIESAFNPQASTRAALDYLQKLYGMFGDWHLALAAYNWGEGSVGRAIARNKKAGLSAGYLDLNMPAETRLYVPKLQAVKNIVANPQGFRTELPLIANHPYFQQVQLSRDIDVALAAKLADVRIEDFKALNPSAHRPVIIASGTPQILLPWDSALVFQRNFDAYNQGQYASWTAWTAPTTLSASEAAKRVGMTENDLRAVNNIPPRMLIKAGSTLLVPRSAKMEVDVASHVADNARVELAPEIVTRRTTVKARKGETVASMAKRYGLSPVNVAEWNSTTIAAAFKASQQVVLFLPVKTSTGNPAAKSKATVKAVSRKPVVQSQKR